MDEIVSACILSLPRVSEPSDSASLRRINFLYPQGVSSTCCGKSFSQWGLRQARSRAERCVRGERGLRISSPQALGTPGLSLRFTVYWSGRLGCVTRDLSLRCPGSRVEHGLQSRPGRWGAGLVALWPVGSQFPDEGSNLHVPHCRADWDHPGSLSLRLVFTCLSKHSFLNCNFAKVHDTLDLP